MKIVGYSERGAMDALFYGMAFKNDTEGENDIRKFLELAQIEEVESFSDFEIYNEFSLSEFGEPDLVIIAKRKKDPVVFFVEAKVSEGTSYNIDNQKEKHEKDLNYYKEKSLHNKNDASNLFFQLRLKRYFFEQRNTIIKPIGELNGNTIGEHECIEKTKDRSGNVRFRKLGANPIVIEFAEKIKPCVQAHYIAIIPKPSDEIIETDDELGFPIHYITWEKIKEEFVDNGILQETIKFNQKEDPKTKKTKSLILNNPK